MIRLNAKLSNIHFVKKDMKPIDIDIYEFMLNKISQSQKTKQTYFEISFLELTKEIGKYKSQYKSLRESIQRLSELTIQTDVKQSYSNGEDKYDLSFEMIGKTVFGVTVDINLYKLVKNEKPFFKYNQSQIYKLRTKYSKLLYKFTLNYRLLDNGVSVDASELAKILNLHNDMTYSEFNHKVIKESVKKINELTDLDLKVDIDKYGKDCYRYIFKTKDWKAQKEKKKTDSEKRIDVFIKKHSKNLKKEIEDNGKIPYFKLIIENKSYFISDNYKLTQNTFDFITDNANDTMLYMNEMINNESLDITIEYLDGYPKGYDICCLISKAELKRKGFI